MNQIQMIDKIPGLRGLLDKCEDDVKALTGQNVRVYFKIVPTGLTVSELSSVICEVCEVHWWDIVSESKKASFVVARHLFCYFAYYHLEIKLNRIAEILKRDHTTVMYANNKVKNMIETNDELYIFPAKEIENRLNRIMRFKPISEKNEG